MRDIVIVSRASVRAEVLAAVGQQWRQDMADKVERSPEGHQEALADAVMATIPAGAEVHIRG